MGIRHVAAQRTLPMDFETVVADSLLTTPAKTFDVNCILARALLTAHHWTFAHTVTLLTTTKTSARKISFFVCACVFLALP